MQECMAVASGWQGETEGQENAESLLYLLIMEQTHRTQTHPHIWCQALIWRFSANSEMLLFSYSSLFSYKCVRENNAGVKEE